MIPVPAPNPTMRVKLLDEEAVYRHRSLFCPEYDGCLEVAVSGGWTSWSCERCPLATRATRHLVLVVAGRADVLAGEPRPAGTP